MDASVQKDFVRFLAILDTLHDFCGNRNKGVGPQVVKKYAVFEKGEVLLQFLDKVPTDDATRFQLKKHAESLLEYQSFLYPSFEHSTLEFVKAILAVYGMSVPEVTHRMLNKNDRAEFVKILQTLHPENDDDADFLRYIYDTSKLSQTLLCGKGDKVRIVETSATLFDSAGQGGNNEDACHQRVNVSAFGLTKAENELMQYGQVMLSNDEIKLGERSIKIAEFKKLRMGVNVYGDILGHVINNMNIEPSISKVMSVLHIQEDFVDVASRVKAMFDFKRCGDWLQIQSCIPLQQAAADKKKFVFLTIDNPAVARAISVPIPNTNEVGVPVIYTSYNSDGSYKITTYGKIKLNDEAKEKKKGQIFEMATARKYVSDILNVQDAEKLNSVFEALDDLEDAIRRKMRKWNEQRNRSERKVALPDVTSDVMRTTKIMASSVQLELLCELFTHLLFTCGWCRYFYDAKLTAMQQFIDRFKFVEDAKQTLESANGAQVDDDFFIKKTNDIFRLLSLFYVTNEQMMWLFDPANIKNDVENAMKWLDVLMENRENILRKTVPVELQRSIAQAIDEARNRRLYLTFEILQYYTKMTRFYPLYDGGSDKATLVWVRGNENPHKSKQRYFAYAEDIEDVNNRITMNVKFALLLPQNIELVQRREELRSMVEVVQKKSKPLNTGEKRVVMTTSKVDQELRTLEFSLLAMQRKDRIAPASLKAARARLGRIVSNLSRQKSEKVSKPQLERIAKTQSLDATLRDLENRPKGVKTVSKNVATVRARTAKKSTVAPVTTPSSLLRKTARFKRQKVGGNQREYMMQYEMNSFAESICKDLRQTSIVNERPYIVEWLALACGLFDEPLPKTDRTYLQDLLTTPMNEQAFLQNQERYVQVPVHHVDITDAVTMWAFVGVRQGMAVFDAERYTSLMLMLHIAGVDSGLLSSPVKSARRAIVSSSAISSVATIATPQKPSPVANSAPTLGTRRKVSIASADFAKSAPLPGSSAKRATKKTAALPTSRLTIAMTPSSVRQNMSLPIARTTGISQAVSE